MRRIIIFLLCLVTAVGASAQSIPQVNAVPWYQFSRKLSIEERLRLPLDTLSIGSGTVRDTSGLIAYKNGKVYFLKNSVWTEVGTGALSGDTLYVINGPSSANLDTLARVPVSGDSLIIKSIGIVAGSNVTVTKSVGLDSIKYTISATGGGGSSGLPSFYDGQDTAQINWRNVRIWYQEFADATNGQISYLSGDSARIVIAAEDSLVIGRAGDNSITKFRNMHPSGDSVLYIDNNYTLRNKLLQDTVTVTTRGQAGTRYYPVRFSNDTVYRYPLRDSTGIALSFAPDSAIVIRATNAGSVTSVATNTATGITGGPITSTGTLAIDTTLIATRAYVIANGGGGGGGTIDWGRSGNTTTGADTVLGTINDNAIRVITGNTEAFSVLRAGFIGRSPASGTNVAGSELKIAAGQNTGSGNPGEIGFYQSSIGASGTSISALTKRMVLNNAGEFIVGTTTTDNGSFNFQVNGTAYTTGNIRTTGSLLLTGAATTDRSITAFVNMQMTTTTGSAHGSSTTIQTLTRAGGQPNTGTAKIVQTKILPVVNRGTQDGTETALEIDFSVTGTAADRRAIEVLDGRSIFKSIQTAITSKTAAYTITDYDHTVTCNASGGAFTVTLPTAVNRAGITYVIKKTDSSSNTVTVATTSSQTIDGSTTYTGLSAQYKYVQVQSDGANWIIIGNN